jgi:hypothetical protein
VGGGGGCGGGGHVKNIEPNVGFVYVTITLLQRGE